MAHLYGPFFEKVWRDALILPGFENLVDSHASEVASYFRISTAEARARMQEAWDNRADQQNARLSGRHTKNAIREYYVEQQHGVFASMYWHSLMPDRWALHSVAALQYMMQFAEGRRVFEFGHGVGSSAILFSAHGFEVVLGDVSRAYRDFAGDRLRARQRDVRFLDLVHETPEPESYDVVVSLDVLEHIPNPIPELQTLWRCLKPGGVMILGICFGRDPNQPEHLLHHRFGVLDRIRPLGLERIPTPSLFVYYKRALSGARKMLYRFQDMGLALLADLNAAGVPLVWRLTHTAMSPPEP
jgi:2-polyprenyl-3-methyl-5-hydroxy-6-metoxy-1,4-benzoquinol methylase